MSDPATTARDAAGPFSRTTLWAVGGVAAISLIVAAVLTIFGDELGGGSPSAGADTFSRSAIGHRGLVDLLEDLRIPVVRSRNDSAEKARNGVLVIAEPAVSDTASRDKLRAMARSGVRVLVVLPKWYGRAQPGAHWVDEVDAVPEREVEQVLEALGLEETALVRKRIPVPLASYETGPALPAPKLREPQLVTSNDLEPQAGDGAEGSLLAVQYLVDGIGELWILSDPDVLNNHGLRTPENARFTIALIDRLRLGGPVVFDEVIHGYADPPSLVRTLFRFPIVLATLQVLICALLAVWAAMVRFGPRRAAPPPFAPGKDFLIQNTAALLHYGGHHADALRRYLVQSAAAVRHALHAPSLSGPALTAWLDRVGQARGAHDSLAELERLTAEAATPQRTIEVALRVHRWRMEMTHGARDRS